MGFVRFDTFDYPEHRCSYALVLLPSSSLTGEITWRAPPGENLLREHICGRHICFIGPNVPHTSSLKGPSEILLLLVRPSFLDAELGKSWSGVVVSELASIVSSDRTVWWLISMCLRLCRQSDVKDYPLIEEIGRGLARRLLAIQFGTHTGRRTKRTVLSQAQMRKVTDYIEADWRRVAAVDELAKVVGLSRVHFTRVFKNTTSASPARYQRICRMHRAQVLLRTGNYRVEEVAASLGFDDASYFSRCFRQDFDMSPSEYMAEHSHEMS